jgi:hypothetical protein
VLYLNNYYLWEGDLEKPEQREILNVLKCYSEYRRLKFDKKTSFTCQNPECRATYNIHQALPKGYKIRCPSCLRITNFPEGWLLETKNSANVFSRIFGIQKGSNP